MYIPKGVHHTHLGVRWKIKSKKGKHYNRQDEHFNLNVQRCQIEIGATETRKQ
jgi:hypothetical protein